MSTALSTVAAPVPVPAAASVRGPWLAVLRDWTMTGAATIVCQLLGAATSVALRLALDPAQMGVWQTLKLLLAHGNYANLGVSKGAARELSIAMGRGDLAPVRRDINLAFTVNTLTSLLYGAVLVSAGIWIGVRGAGPWSGVWALGLIAIGGLSVVQRYLSFQVTLLRAQQCFATTALLSVLEAVLTLAVCAAATWWFGIAGLCVGTLVVLVVSTVFVHRSGALRVSWAWDGPETRRLMAIGLPILLSGIVLTLFRTLDKWMIVAYLSDREFQLGCYSLGLMVSGWIYGWGNMLAIVVAPRLGQRYGYTGSQTEAARLAAACNRLQAAAVIFPAGLAIVALPPLLGWLLPAYRSGLAPLDWMIPGVVASALGLVPVQYLITVDRQRWALGAVIVGTVVAALSIHVALKGGYGLTGVAAASSLAWIVYLGLVAWPGWLSLPSAHRLRHLGLQALFVVPPLAIAFGSRWLLPSHVLAWPIVAARVLLFLAVFIACAVPVWRYREW